MDLQCDKEDDLCPDFLQISKKALKDVNEAKFCPEKDIMKNKHNPEDRNSHHTVGLSIRHQGSAKALPFMHIRRLISNQPSLYKADA